MDNGEINFNAEYDPYVFKRPDDEYEIQLAPVKEYIQQATTYISKVNNVPYDVASVQVKSLLKNSRIKNPEVRYNEKQENGDMIVTSTKLTDYIKSVLVAGDVIVPSFTTYMHPSIKKSLHADYLSINIAARKSDKKNAHKFEQQGDMDKALYYDVMQKTRKVANNSLSGSYASKSTILCNPSAHYTLTSMTRCVASIGNSITESMVGGNKHFRSPSVVMNYITAIITNMNRIHVELAIHKFNLHLPTVDEVMKSILRSSNHYWVDKIAENDIVELLKSLDPIELATVLYTNDLWHVKEYNDAFTRLLVKRLIEKVPTGSVNHLDDIYKAPEGVSTLAHFVCMDDIRGKTVEYDKLIGTPLLDTIASTCRNISTVLSYYKPLITAFFSTDILPIDIAYIREMIREDIVLSDTDSTCGSYDQWVNWYFGNPNFETIGMAMSAAIMTINTQAMDHNIKQFARNMNIETKRVDLLKMKNEFFWSVFITANKNKHYFASTLVKEGNVYAKPKLERKGVHLIASAIDQKLVKLSEEMMVDIMDKLTHNIKLPLLDYVSQVADIERELKIKVDAGDISIFKTEKIKAKDAYKGEEDKSPYIHHLVWQNVFAEKYGSPGDPMYMVIKIPILAKKKADLKNFLEGIKDEDIKERWGNFLDEFEKDQVGTFKPPLIIVSSKGIPEEVKHVIDYKRIIFDNCMVFYNILEAIGFYRKPDKLISEMGY